MEDGSRRSLEDEQRELELSACMLNEGNVCKDDSNMKLTKQKAKQLSKRFGELRGPDNTWFPSRASAEKGYLIWSLKCRPAAHNMLRCTDATSTFQA